MINIQASGLYRLFSSGTFCDSALSENVDDAFEMLELNCYQLSGLGHILL